MYSRSRKRRIPVVLGAVMAMFLAFGAAQASAGAVITNGTVSLGVNDYGELNFDFVGVMHNATGNDGTRAGCPCEGWGAGNGGGSGGAFEGAADQNFWSAGLNLDLISFTSTASTATSVVEIDGKLRVTQAYAPSLLTPNLYEDTVTLENISGAPLDDVRYTRLMDWDVEPTAFNEFVTIQGTNAENLLFSNNDGFDLPLPLNDRNMTGIAGQTGVVNQDFTDKGPADHGALFDFGFGALGTGESLTFSVYYGAAASETEANLARSLALTELYSFGQPSGGETTGEPTTFIFGFKGVGGGALPPEDCDNGIDDDGDGDIDGADSDCTEGPPGDASCSDDFDNDGDTKVDQADEDCQSPEGPVGDASCSDGVDNDGDGQTDGADTACQTSTPTEGPVGDATCSDGQDNDGDGQTDGADSDCQASTDPCDAPGVIHGTDGPDVIVGTDGPDVICAGDGDDRVAARAGNDTVYGEGGRDRLLGQADDDTVNGGDGDDLSVNGGAGNDLVRGQNGADSVLGDTGDDNVQGNDGVDELLGGADADLLNGGEGNDHANGGVGGDTVNGGIGDDELLGSDGDDLISGNAGNDTAIGNAGNDLVNGNVGNDKVQGREGNDRLHGQDGDDTLSGQADNDRVVGGNGADRAFGNDGTDTVQVQDGAGVDLADCGPPADDRFDADGGDTVVNCEIPL